MEAPAPIPTPMQGAMTDQQVLDLWKMRSSRVDEFAGLLGLRPDGKSASGLPPNLREKALSKMISETLEDHEVLLTVPSLDMGLAESKDLNPLPVIGGAGQRKDGTSTATPDSSKPTMTASVLTVATEGAANSEQIAAQNIEKLTSWTKSTLGYASDAMKKNVSTSFATLVDSRVRAWTLLLLRHSLSSGDNESRSKLMRMLSSNIQVNKVSTKYKTLTLKDSAAFQTREFHVISPMLFEVVLDVSVQDKEEQVTLRAPGTISANFDSKLEEPGLTKVAMRLTSAKLLSAMVEQARMVVLKTVATATKTEVPLDELNSKSSSLEAVQEHSTTDQSERKLAGFGSSLNLTTSTSSASSGGSDAPRLQKARASALKLTSVLHHKGEKDNAGSLGIRKVRSVKWDQPVNLTPSVTSVGLSSPSAKKFKATNANKLKSFKSFGRPHAGDGGRSGPRNATFAEFNRSGASWGRDGRMSHHPTPQQAGQSVFADNPAPKGNATFDLARPGASAGAAALLGRTSSSRLGLQSKLGLSSGMSSARLGMPSPRQSRPSASLPRTATALENFILKKSTSGSGGAKNFSMR